MSVDEKLKNYNLDLQKKIVIEIENVKKGVCRKNLNQLYSILWELDMMLKTNGLNLNFPRYIIDSWDYSDNLGKSLLELAELYSRKK